MAKVYQANEIKNVAMLGGSGSGKTTLMESMLFESGVIKRRGSIESQSTVCDYFPVEKEYGYSVFSTVCNIEFEGKKLNVIDCAGSDDFCGGTMAALQMCGSALIVLSANGGVEVGTQNNFRLVEKVKKPLAFVINKCDHQDADFDRTFNQLKENFGNKCTLIQFPVNAGNGFNAVIDVLKGKMLVWKAEGGAPEFKEIPAEYADRVEEMRQQLQEQAAEADETLLDKFLSEGLTDEEIMQGLKSVYADGSMYPVICTSGLKDMGVRRLMDFLNGMAPSPAQFSYPTVDGNRVSPDASAPTSLYVFKTSVEPHIGEVSYFRVMQGTVRNGDDMQNMERGSKERISQLYMVAGANRIPVDEVAAGDTGEGAVGVGVDHPRRGVAGLPDHVPLLAVAPKTLDIADDVDPLPVLRDRDPELGAEDGPRIAIKADLLAVPVINGQRPGGGHSMVFVVRDPHGHRLEHGGMVDVFGQKSPELPSAGLSDHIDPSTEPIVVTVFFDQLIQLGVAHVCIGRAHMLPSLTKLSLYYYIIVLHHGHGAGVNFL